MDLWAYANIGEEEIEELIKKNNIDCPRLRGYRLMKNEKPILDVVDLRSIEVDTVDHYLRATRCGCFEYSAWTNYKVSKHISGHDSEYNKETSTWSEDTRQVMWDTFNCKTRKKLKLRVKHKIRDINRQYDMFNKYCGRDDILYIHSRIGGWNWPDYFDQVVNQPWFIEKVDDSFDSTYCDIYARIS